MYIKFKSIHVGVHLAVFIKSAQVTLGPLLEGQRHDKYMGKFCIPVTVTFISARQHAEHAICYRKSVCLSVCHTGGSVENG